MNYIDHHKEVSERLMLGSNLKTQHISLYNTLFFLWNRNHFPEELMIFREELMNLSHIGNKNTYTNTLNDLHNEGFITYKPSFNPLKGSKISFTIFGKSGGKGSGKGDGYASGKGDGKGDGTYFNKLINKETIKLINSNVDLVNSKISEWIDSVKSPSNPFKEFSLVEVLDPYPFEEFWMMYDKKVGKDKCIQKWKKIDSKSKAIIFEMLPNYVLSKPDIKFRLNPLTYLNGKHWEDEIIFNNETVKQIQNEQVNQNLLEIIAANPGVY